MAELLSGHDGPVSRLIPDARTESVQNTLRDIARRALANKEEKGLHTLFVALGMATWTASDAGRPTEAPMNQSVDHIR